MPGEWLGQFIQPNQIGLIACNLGEASRQGELVRSDIAAEQNDRSPKRLVVKSLSDELRHVGPLQSYLLALQVSFTN